MQTTSSKISAIVITFNEENHIDALIPNLSFADEILVIDSYSTDATFDKLTSFPNIRVIQHEFKDFADQRNFAISKANYDWILFIDADERIPNKLKTEILKVVNSASDIIAYKFKRRFIFNNKVIRFSGFQTDKIYRLFKKSHAKYKKDIYVHEQLDVKGKSAVLKNIMTHYSFNDYDSYKNKVIHYATLKAKELFDKGKSINLLKRCIKPIYKFVYNYIFRLGILDGKAGLVICYLNAYGVWYRSKELKRLKTLSPKE